MQIVMRNFFSLPRIMTKLLFLFNCLFFIKISNAQTSHELILKYDQPKMYSNLYFGNGITEEIVFYESLEKMLNFQQFACVEIDFYIKKVRQSRQFINYRDGKLNNKLKRSVWTIPSRTYHFFHGLPNSFFILFDRKRKSISPIELKYEKDSFNRIISCQSAYWQEKYLYDINNNLIKIDANVIPSSKDLNIRDGGFDCVVLWNGKFENGNIIEEIFNWSNGLQDIIKHKWENNLLIESSTDFNTENINTYTTIKYYYDNRKIIERMEYYGKTGKLMWSKKFNWE
jgi:hypothetical protein